MHARRKSHQTEIDAHADARQTGEGGVNRGVHPPNAVVHFASADLPDVPRDQRRAASKGQICAMGSGRASKHSMLVGDVGRTRCAKRLASLAQQSRLQ
jgi:hypothetical protein